MKLRKDIIQLFIIFTIFIIMGTSSIYAGEKKEAPKDVVVTRYNNRALKLKWKKQKNVDGYLIYRYDKKTKKYKHIKTIKGNNHTEYVDKKLKTNKIYRYKLVAYKKVGNKTYKSHKSDWVSAKTYKKKTKYINAGRIIGTKKLILGITESKKLKLTVKASRFGTNVMSYPISTKLRWRSSNNAIATVDPSRKVKAGITNGTCYIYAKAHNGNEKKIKVEVKDFTHPKDFSLYDGEIPIVNEMLVNFKDEICDITNYLVCNNIGKDVFIYQNGEESYYVSPEGLNTNPIDESLRKLLFDFPTRITISLESNCVEFSVKYYDGTGNYDALIYMIDNDGLNKSLIDAAVASHWQAISFRPH